MKITEKIDGSLAVPFTEGNDAGRYDFEIGDLEYEVEFWNRRGNISELVFTATNPKNPLGTHKQIPVGVKVAMQVFHTIWMIIRDFLSYSSIEMLEFSAKSSEPSRIKFYRTLAKQLALERGYQPEDVEEVMKHGDFNFIVPVAK